MPDDHDDPTRPAGHDRDDTLFHAHQPQARAGSGRHSAEGDRGSERRHERRGGAGAFFRELPVLLLVAFVLAFLLRTFVVQVFWIPSGSMEPTLQVNDRIAVEKLTYRFREPARGDVVVFEGDEVIRDPDSTTGERLVRGFGQFLGVVPANARDFVKRVIGLPGDEIVIEDGQVSVNGVPLDEPYVVFEDPSDYGPVTVPDGHLFFLGDNRPNSSDSRSQLGFVRREQVVGRAALVIWPIDHLGSLLGVRHDLADPPDAAATASAPAVGSPSLEQAGV